MPFKFCFIKTLLVKSVSWAGEMAQLLKARLTTKAMRVFSLEDVQSERHHVILAVILQGNSSTLPSRRNGLMVPLSNV